MTDPGINDLMKSGHGHLARQDYAAAHAVADRLLRDFEHTPDTLLFAGEVQFLRGNYAGTSKLAEDCMTAFPEDPAGGILRCRALMAMGQQGEARDLALDIAKLDIKDDRHVDILVTILSGCLVPEAAYPLARAAVERDPYDAKAHRRLALTCRLIGKLDEALEHAKIAIRFDAHDYEMVGLRSNLRSATPEDNNIAELEALLTEGCRSQLGASRVAYALAKELEEVGRYERAFAVLNAAATFKRQTINFRPEEDLETFATLRNHFTRERIEKASPGCDSGEPIFILGLPRTGSTLLERIIAGHPDVYAAGELLHFDAAMMIGVRERGAVQSRGEIIEHSSALDMAALGQRYIERTRPYTGHTARFIDKRPLNFVSLGVIRMALPNAKVVHVRRTPMDACYSIYKFLFNEAYPWSYSLDEIADYYIAYRQLMDHWRSVMGDYVIDVAYEDVVDDIETASRGLFERLELAWDPAVLDFHKSDTATMTGSAVQVRQKLYSSSVGRWKSYEEQLQPLANKLAAADLDPYSP